MRHLPSQPFSWCKCSELVQTAAPQGHLHERRMQHTESCMPGSRLSGSADFSHRAGADPQVVVLRQVDGLPAAAGPRLGQTPCSTKLPPSSQSSDS